MDEMSSGGEYDAEPLSTDIIKEICYRIQYHPSINRREARYNISYHIKQKREEWKVVLLSTRSMGKISHKVFKAVVNEISESLSIMGDF